MPPFSKDEIVPLLKWLHSILYFQHLIIQSSMLENQDIGDIHF